MSSVLACIAAATHRDGIKDWYGAAEYDYETQEIVWKFDATQTDFDTAKIIEDGRVLRHRGYRPASVERLDDGTTLLSGWRRGVIADEDGDVYKSFTHELMNDVHEMQKTSRGTILVASTGMDVLLEFDRDFNLIWTWKMWKHLPEHTRPGDYYPAEMEDKDVRGYAMYPDNRYHLNYATYLGQGQILCSALNYGVFMVDRHSNEITKEWTRLDECHNPTINGVPLTVAESGKDRIVQLDSDMEFQTIFDEGLNFPKDADPIPGSKHDIYGAEEWLITDTKNGRSLVMNAETGQVIKEFAYGEKTAPYEADYLTGGDSFA